MKTKPIRDNDNSRADTAKPLLAVYKDVPCSHGWLRHNEAKPLYCVECHLDYIYRPTVNSFSAAYSFFLLDCFQAESSSISPTSCLHKSFPALWGWFANLFSLVPIHSSSVEAGQSSMRDTRCASEFSTGCVFRKENHRYAGHWLF